MKTFVFALIAVIVAFPISSHATTQYLASKSVIVASTSISEYAGNQVNVVSTTLPTACNGALYVLHEDKEVFAEVLAAQLNNQTVSIYYNDAAPAVSTGVTYGTCKIIWVSRS